MMQKRRVTRQGGYLPRRCAGDLRLPGAEAERPLLLEGEAGVGKTELAKVLAAVLGRPLVRLQCYEGLDSRHGRL